MSEDPALAELESVLEVALADALGDLPPGPMLYKRLRRVVEARLQTRLGRGAFKSVDKAQVLIGEGPVEGTITVELRLHRGATVRHVRLAAGMI